MTYKLNPELSKILSPVILLFPDGNREEYENGRFAAEATFSEAYQVFSMTAVNNKVEIQLSERSVPEISSENVETISFF